MDDLFTRNYAHKFGIYDSKGEVDLKDLIDRSEIIVVDYLSSAYLQALASNIPSIILYDENAYPLDRHYKDFYDELIESKIFHKDPRSAANFLQQIQSDPYIWWNRKETQNARKEFLKNFNPNQEDIVDKFLNLLG